MISILVPPRSTPSRTSAHYPLARQTMRSRWSGLSRALLGLFFLRLFTEGAGYLSRRRRRAIRIARAIFLLRNRTAAGFVRCVAIRYFLQRQFPDAACRILRRRRVGVHPRM